MYTDLSIHKTPSCRGAVFYNGSVSAMTWTMGTDTRVRGYKYTYNGYGWLTAAEYGENQDLGANLNRYTERFLDFMRNGGVRRLQRYGLKADGIYGKVDNLHIKYDGNRIKSVLEDAAAVTQNGSMDYPGGNKEMGFSYNEWGGLTSDESRGITDITYDNFGNPTQIKFSNSSKITNGYSATGEKLWTTMAYGVSLNSEAVSPLGLGIEQMDVDAAAPSAVLPKIGTEYHGPIIYSNGKPDMVLFPGGYASLNGTEATFHYYTQDYLGNNRAVINGSTGAIEQTIAYYPYGGVIADLGTPTTGHPYKFGGKELITANGLNEYDFGARRYYQAIPHFTSIDPIAEKYPWLSPYLFCANNPVNYTDPTGMYILPESQDEWNRNKKNIVDRRNRLQNDIDKTKAKGAKKGWSAAKIANKIGDKQERVASLDKTLSTMSTIENSEQGYYLNQTSGEGGLSLENGIIKISYNQSRYNKSKNYNFVHEVTHAGQFETGDIAFNQESGNSYLVDIYDEMEAYAAQYAYEPSTLLGINPTMSISSMSDISPSYVMGIQNYSGNPYAPGGSNNVGCAMVRIDSPIQQLLYAFPNNIGYINFVNNNRYIRQMPNIYYKK